MPKSPRSLTGRSAPQKLISPAEKRRSARSSPYGTSKPKPAARSRPCSTPQWLRICLDLPRLEALLRGAPRALTDDAFATRVLATRVPAALPPPAGLGPVLALVTPTPWSALPNTGRPILRALAPIGANRTDPTVLAAFPLATASALDALRPSVGRRTT